MSVGGNEVRSLRRLLGQGGRPPLHLVQLILSTVVSELTTGLALMVFIGYSYAELNHLDKEYQGENDEQVQMVFRIRDARLDARCIPNGWEHVAGTR
jgi:hypothetical protein